MKFYWALFKASLKKNLLRYLVILITIAITVSVAVASRSITDNAVSGRDEQFRNNTLNSQILVKLKKTDDGGVYFEYDKALEEKLKGVPGVKTVMVRTGGNAIDITNDEYMNIVGMDIVKQNEVYAFKLSEGEIGTPSEDSIIINKDYATQCGYKVGSKITCLINDKEKEFTVIAISENEGIFSPGVNTCVALRSTVEKLIDKEGFIYSMGLTLDNLENITNTVIEVGKVLPDTLEAEQTYDLEHFKAYVGTIRISLMVVSAVFVLVLVFNFYITVKLIVTEKKKQYAALNKMGIPVKALRKEMLFENVTIAILSALFGDGLSFLIVRIVYSILRVSAPIEIDLITVAIADVAVLIMVIMFTEWAFFKGFYLKEKTVGIGIKRLKTAFSVLLYAVSAFASVYLFEEAKLNGERKMIYLIIGFLLMLLSVEGLAGKFFELLFGFLHKAGSKSIFTIEMDVNSKRFVNILRILSLLAMAFFMSFSIRSMVETEVAKISQAADYRFVSFEDTGYEKELEELSEGTIVSKQKDVSYKLKNSTIRVISIDDVYKDYFSCETIQEGNEDMYDKLGEGKNVIISVSVSHTEKIGMGDTLVLGNVPYKVTGVVTSFNNMGKVAYIAGKNFDEDLGSAASVTYLIKSDADDDLMVEGFNRILYTHEDEESYFNDARENNENNSKNNTMTFNLVSVLIIFCALAGMIGISNNIYIETMARRKNISVKRLLGFKKKSIVFGFLKESVLNFLFSTAVGTVLGILAGIYLMNILEDYIGNVSYRLKPIHFVATGAIILVVSLLSYSFSARKAVKMDALEEVNASGM